MVKTKNKKKLFKKTRKTRQYYGNGGTSETSVAVHNTVDRDKSNESNESNESNDSNNDEGVITILKQKLKTMAESTGEYLKNKSLRLLGLQTIKNNEENIPQNEENEQTKQIDETLKNVGTGVISNINTVGKDIVDVANKGSASILENVNEVLGSPQLNETITEAVGNTKDILSNDLKTLNATVDDPEFKTELKESLDNISEYAKIGVDALDKPLDKFTDKIGESAKTLTEKVGEGVVSDIETAAMETPIGPLVALTKIANNAAETATAVSKTVAETAKGTQNLIEETKEKYDDLTHKADSISKFGDAVNPINLHNNLHSDLMNKADSISKLGNDSINDSLQKLQPIKQDGGKIVNRIYESIQQFENPNSILLNDYKKTKKNLLKPKGKSKRVKFAV